VEPKSIKEKYFFCHFFETKDGDFGDKRNYKGNPKESSGLICIWVN